ncbi:hypothetical protein [Pontimicrobium sp. IMCC45349]|jgi:hypothetical protein|uniref:hypothetical protein n=1 Tax=Pontimicrobium sp. IMCC45349 TaxID=3391574 RepID=UPI0039A34094
MKKILLLIICVSFYFSANSQNTRDDQYSISLGVNAVSNLGTRSPFEKFDDWAFENPIALGFQVKWNKLFGVEQSVSFNKFTQNSFIDGAVLSKDHSYFATNTNFKYYVGEHLINSEKLDIFLNGGIGVFQIEDLNTSLNAGGGITYWFSEEIGIRYQSLAKFALNTKDYIYDNNHFQHFFELMYRF